MELAMRLVLTAIVSVVLTGACSGAVDPEMDKAAAERAVEHWIALRPAEWPVSVTGRRAPTRPEWSRPCDQDPPNNLTALRYRERDVDVLLFFNCPVGVPHTAQALADAFAFMVIDELPHGIRSSNWRFTVSTPVSSFTEGVTFSMPRTGTLRVDVATPLFAVYGQNTRPACEPLPDSPARPECWLQRPYPATLRLGVSMPFAGTELR